jgi:hypothetical protein
MRFPIAINKISAETAANSRPADADDLKPGGQSHDRASLDGLADHMQFRHRLACRRRHRLLLALMFSNCRCLVWPRTCQVFHFVTFVRAIDHRNARGQRRHIVFKMGGKQATEESHEADESDNNCCWSFDVCV